MAAPRKFVITFQDIFHFATRFVKYWKTALLLFILGAMLSLVYYTFGKPTFYSRSLVGYSYLNLPVSSETSDVQGTGKWAQISSVLGAALNSRWLVEHTAQRLGLVDEPGQYEYIRDKFLSSVRVSALPGNLLQIEAYGFQPWIVRDWPEAMLEAYKEFTLKQREKHRDAALAGYSAELDRLKEKISEEASSSAKFEEDNHLIEQYIDNNSLEGVPSEMLTLKMRIESMEQVLAMMEKLKLEPVEQLSLFKKFRGAPVPVGTILRQSNADRLVTRMAPAVTSPLAGMTSNAPMSAQQQQNMTGDPPKGQQVIVVPGMVDELEPWEQTERELRSLKQEYETAAKTFLPGHEKMRALTKKVEELKASLVSELNTNTSRFQLEMEHLKERFVELQKKMPDYRKVLNDFDRYKQEYSLVNSGKLLWETAYADLQRRLSSMEYTGIDMKVSFEFQGFTLLRDDVPVSPNKEKLLMYGLMLGVGLAAGGCFGLEKLRSTTSLVTETEKLTGLNAVGVLPLVKGGGESLERSLLSAQYLPNADVNVGETFRIIRCSLPLYVARDNRCQVIMVTSSRPGEGKTMISSLLARSFAESDQRTLLIDGDMRRGRLHRVFNIQQSDGLSTYLDREIPELGQAVHTTNIPNLDVLTRGKHLQPKFEALGSAYFIKTIEALRGEYDRIIIDTPPLLGLADSIMVRQSVDGCLMVIRAEKTTQRDILTALEMLSGTAVPIYGFVLNGVDLSNIENYYYYSSYYPKYYDPSYLPSPELDDARA